ncbi:hypothetical protein LCGC14_0698600 [marine sediment metagenome]|uniref:Uncharacterized protein n=1 Tax=marine sediment metagenome TaxID=412755 RepID=A0A0F9T4G5_9ZZZZ
MGAEQFESQCIAETAEDAFNRCVSQALYDYGHAGYTGTIAEKSDYTEVRVPEGLDLDTFLKWSAELEWGDVKDKIPPHHMAAVERAAAIYDDKWGPALCVQDPPTEPGQDPGWVFCGWASS